MIRFARVLCIASVLTVAGGGLIGCPAQPDFQVAVIVDPGVLDFGDNLQVLTFQASKVWSSRPLPTFTVSSSSPWITVFPVSGDSVGPEDKVLITVTIDRSKLNAGDNEGRVVIIAEGVVQATVKVLARANLVARFVANKTTVGVNEVVQFTDLSQSVEGPIISWLWDFGNGQTSTLQHPTTVYTGLGAYTVTLTVTTAKSTASTIRHDYINVVGPTFPTAEFRGTPRNPNAGQPVQFEDLSNNGGLPISAWNWTFGDGGGSNLQNPAHIYTAASQYTVSLTVTNPIGSDSEVKINYISVQPTPPTANFTWNPQQPVSNTPTQFIDQSARGSHDITSWLWDFGDGSPSPPTTTQNPVHTYTAMANYVPVRLTVSNAVGSDTLTKQLSVAKTATAAFDLSSDKALTIEPVKFYDHSVPAANPITSRLWDFGDGITSTEAEPAHTFATPGAYPVTLAVSDGLSSSSVSRDPAVTVFAATELDRYVRENDGAYQAGFGENDLVINGGSYTAHAFTMTSQQWNEASAPDDGSTRWSHLMMVVVPNRLTHHTALLFVGDGRAPAGSPNASDPRLQSLASELGNVATQTNAVVGYIEQVPNEPLVLSGTPEGVELAGEPLLAATLDRFLDDPSDDRSPLLLPMVKSVVRAMDTVQAFVATETPDAPAVLDFVVAEMGSRGWTTWLAAATDWRVTAIAPIATDMLSLRAELNHHSQSNGGYAESLRAYIDLNVFGRLDSDRGTQLLKVIDPFEYRERRTIDVFPLTGANDPLLAPNSLSVYLEGQAASAGSSVPASIDSGLANSLAQFFRTQATPAAQ